jgi:hypothetical protein
MTSAALFMKQKRMGILYDPFSQTGSDEWRKVSLSCSAQDEDYLLRCFAKHGIEVEACLASGQLEILKPSFTLPILQTSNMDEIIQTFKSELDQYCAQGFKNLRLTVNRFPNLWKRRSDKSFSGVAAKAKPGCFPILCDKINNPVSSP